MANRKTAPAGGGSTRFFYIVLAVIAVFGIAAIVYTLGASGGTATEPVDLSGLDDPRQLYEMAAAVKQGSDDAPVKVVEFADYQCGGCRSFALGVKPTLSSYIDQGQVQFIYYDFPLTEIHAHSFLAARAVRCAGDQDHFWDYQHLVFTNQASWAAKADPAADFIDMASQVGLDAGAFSSCVKSDRYADVVTANRELAIQLGINSTPTLIVNNRRLVAPSARSLNDMIEAELNAGSGG